ncbi:MAG: alpha/beta fold hydrolase [Chloroflexota bacterium]
MMQKVNGVEHEIHGEVEPVLLIHGSLVADAFLPLARENALADRYRLIRYHRRGYVGSDPHDGPFSVEEQAQDAEMLLDALGVESAHVVGHSFGGLIAMQMACQESSVVHSLTLLEPSKTTEHVDRSQVIDPAMAHYRSGDLAEAVNSFVAAGCGPDWRAETERTVPGGPDQAETDAATFFEVDIPSTGSWILDEDRAQRISQPVLYVLGGESGPGGEHAKRAFRSAVPQTEEVVLQGLNHLMQIRDPNKVAVTIAGFLERHPLREMETLP